MNRAARRAGMLALSAVLLAPTGCASGRSWHGGGLEVGMMGAMVVGGALFGTGVMHGGSRSVAPDTAFVVDRYAPERLLALRVELELTDEQITGLTVLRDDVQAGRLTPEGAAREAYRQLRPVQRAAAAGAPATPHH
jgi:hypothetical protein